MSSRLSLCAGAAGVFLAAAAPVAADGGAKLDYDVWAGGVRVLEATLTLRVEAERYRLDIEAELVGPPSWVQDYHLVAFAEGVLGEAGSQPELYRQEERNSDDDDKPHWVQLTYSDGLPLIEAYSNLEKKRRHPVTEAQKQGSLDPLTGVLSLVLQAAAKGSCEGIAPIFDGRRRFDVTLADQGSGEMPDSRYNAYAGPTRLCRVTLQPIAGYRKSGTEQEQFPAEVVLQAAELVPGLPALPVRLDTEIAYGALILHLVDYKAIDQELN